VTTVGYCASTINVAVEVMGRNAWRGKPWSRRPLKTNIEGAETADVTYWGKLFQTTGSSNRVGPITDGRKPIDN